MKKKGPNKKNKKGSAFVHTGINLFAYFTQQDTANQRSMQFKSGFGYNQSEFDHLKNLFQKCSKKSESTKIKVLREIRALCESAENKQLFIDQLPNWVKIYTRMMKFENDKGVRLGASQVTRTFLKFFKDSFEPFMLDFFPVIWMAQGDLANEVANEAEATLKESFTVYEKPENLARYSPVLASTASAILSHEDMNAPELSEQARQDMKERILGSALSSLAKAIKLHPDDSIKELMKEKPFWKYLDAKEHKTKIRAGALRCIQRVIEKTDWVNDENLPEIAPMVFSKIADKEKKVQRTLWKGTLTVLVEKYKNSWKYVKGPGVMKVLNSCLKHGGFGAGAYLYENLVQFLAAELINFVDVKVANELCESLLAGLKSDETIHCRNLVLNAYYEVVLLMFIKLPNIHDKLLEFLLKPISEMFTNTDKETPNRRYSQLPDIFAEALQYLETRKISIPIWDSLFQILRVQLLKGHLGTIFLLKVLLAKLQSQEYSVYVNDLVNDLHQILSQEIENHICSGLSENELMEKLKVLTKFKEEIKPYKTLFSGVGRWWNYGKASYRSLLTRMLWTEPEEWLNVICNTSFAIVQDVNLIEELIPNTPSEELRNTATAASFQNLFLSILNEFIQSKNPEFFKAISSCLRKCIDGKLLIETTNEKIRTIATSHIKEWSDSNDSVNLSKIIELNQAILKIMDGREVHYISKVLVKHGWKKNMAQLWDTVKLFQDAFKYKAVAEIARLLGGIVAGPAVKWNEVIEVSKLSLEIYMYNEFIQNVICNEQAFRDSHTSAGIWQWITEIAFRLNMKSVCVHNPWLISELLSSINLPPVANNLVLQQRLSDYNSSILRSIISSSNLAFKLNILKELISRSEKHEVYASSLYNFLQVFLQDESSSESVDSIFQELVIPIEDDLQKTSVVCHLIQILREKLRGNEKFEQFKEKCERAVNQDARGRNIQIYAALMNREEEVNDEEIRVFEKAVERLDTTCYTFLLKILQKRGFNLIESHLETINTSLIHSLESCQELVPTLQLLQELLRNPQYILDKEEVCDRVLNIVLTQENLTGPQTSELASTLFSLSSIVSKYLHEDLIFLILLRNNQPLIQKSCFNLLYYTFQKFKLIRQLEQTQGQEPIVASILSILENVPSISAEDHHMTPSVFGYILGWLLILEKFNTDRIHSEKAEEMSDYGVCIKNYLEGKDELVTVFLNCMLAYMPERPEQAQLSVNFDVASTDLLDENSCSQLACYALYQFFRTFPVFARSWYTHADKRLSNLVMNVVSKVISPKVLETEIAIINSKKPEWSTQDINIIARNRDIITNYTKGEVRLSMQIKLPDSYPLRVLTISCVPEAKIPEKSLKKWELSLIKLFNSLNASIYEAIILWKENVDKEIEGIEDCPICYYVVHSSDHTLPRQACKTCNMKFHLSCIRKWFSTSGKNNCPLCQSHFWGQ